MPRHTDCSLFHHLFHCFPSPRDRLTNFLCPRGSSKHTRFPDQARCTGKIDKSHQTIPKNEKRVAKLTAAAPAPSVKPQPAQPQQHVGQRRAAPSGPAQSNAAYQQAKYDKLGLLVPLAPVDGQSESGNTVLVGMDDTAGMSKAQKKNAKRAAAAAAKRNPVTAAVNGGPSGSGGGAGSADGGGGDRGGEEEWQNFADFPDSDNLSIDGYEYARENPDYTSALPAAEPVPQLATVVPQGFSMDLDRYNALFGGSNVVAPAPAPAIQPPPPVPYSNISYDGGKVQPAAVRPLGTAAPVKVNRPLFMTPEQIAALISGKAAAAAAIANPAAAAAEAAVSTEHELRDFPISPGSSASDEVDTLLASITPAMAPVAYGAAAVAEVSSDVSDDDSDEEGELTMEQMMALCST